MIDFCLVDKEKEEEEDSIFPKDFCGAVLYTVTSPVWSQTGEVNLLEIELNTSLKNSGLVSCG